jgi:hypothetical protein
MLSDMDDAALLGGGDFNVWLTGVIDLIGANAGGEDVHHHHQPSSSPVRFQTTPLAAAASAAATHATIADLVTPHQGGEQTFSDEHYTLLRKISVNVLDLVVVSALHVWTIEGATPATRKVAIRKISNGGLVKTITVSASNKLPCKLHSAFGRVYVGYESGLVMAYEVALLGKNAKKTQAHFSQIRCLVSNHDSLGSGAVESKGEPACCLFTAAASDFSIGMYNEGLKQQRQFLGHKSSIQAMLVVRDTLWSVAEDDTLRVWDIASGKTLLLIKQIHSATVVALHATMTPYAGCVEGVWSVSGDGTWKLWDVSKILAVCAQERASSSKRPLALSMREARDCIAHAILPGATATASLADTATFNSSSCTSTTLTFEKSDSAQDGKMSIRYLRAFGVPLDPRLIPSIDPGAKPSVSQSTKEKQVEVIAALSKTDRNVQFFELEQLQPNSALSSSCSKRGHMDDTTAGEDQQAISGVLDRLSSLTATYNANAKQRSAFRGDVGQRLQQEVMQLAYRRVLGEELKRALDRETRELQNKMQQYKLTKDKLRSQVRALKGFRSDYGAMELSFGARKTQILGVADDVDALLQKCNREYEGLAKKKEDIQDEVFGLEEQKEKADAEAVQVDKEIRDLERVVGDYQLAQQDTLHDFDRVQNSVDGLERNIERLQLELEQRRREESEEDKAHAAKDRRAALVAQDIRYEALLAEKRTLEAIVLQKETRAGELEESSLAMRLQMNSLTQSLTKRDEKEYSRIKDLQQQQHLCNTRLRHEAKRHLGLTESIRELDIYKLHGVQVTVSKLQKQALALAASLAPKHRPLVSSHAPDKLKISTAKVKGQLNVIGEKFKALNADVEAEMCKWQPLVEKSNELMPGDTDEEVVVVAGQQERRDRKLLPRPAFALNLAATQEAQAQLSLEESKSARHSQRVWSAMSRSPQGSYRFSRSNSARLLREHLKPDELAQLKNREIMTKLKNSRRSTPDSGKRPTPT